MVTIARDQRDFKLGRIHFVRSGYAFCDQGAVTKSGIKLYPVIDADGKQASAALKESVSNCEAQELCRGKYPMFSRREGQRLVFYVPRSVCRKCQYYLKSERRRHFACCSHLRDRRVDASSPLVQLVSMTDQAVDRAKEILGCHS